MKTDQVTCAACGWVGSIDELDHEMRGEPTCPVCASDEIIYPEKPTVARCRRLVELLRRS